MSGQIIRPHRSMRSPDAKEAALQAVLRGGLNKVLWDDCRLIWDSRSIIDDAPVSEDQMAVFGVKGKVETIEHERLDFQIRYTAIFELEPLYLLYVAVNGTMDGDEFDKDELEVVQRVSPERVIQRVYFHEAVKTLTSKLSSIGPQALIKSFLTSRYGVNAGGALASGVN
ncbi:ABC transporter [Ilyonectria robusta]